MRKRSLLLACLLALPTGPGAQSAVATWTAQHQRAIVDEFTSLLAVPNVARNDADMRRNAQCEGIDLLASILTMPRPPRP